MRFFSILALGLLACDDTVAPVAHPSPATSSSALADAPIPTPTPTVAPQPTAAIVAPPPAKKDFPMDLYAKLAAKPGNLLVSEPSLEQALAIAYTGAKNKTAQEMASTLGFDADPSKVASNAKTDIEAWKTAAGSNELSIANRLWLEKSFPLIADYQKTVNAGWGAGVENVDFTHGAEASRKTINGWVSKQTKDKITELLPQGTIDGNTRLVITNAIYFKGTWQSTFDKAQTKNETFKVDGKTDTQLPLMHKSGQINAGTFDGGKVLELPYTKSTLAMDIFLPDDADGLSKLESNLSTENLTSWTSKLHNQQANVTLPKFTFSYGGSIASQLSALGMKDPFTDSADFSGITKDPGGLKITDVVQKTFIAVDETGTEAAASTGVVMATRGVAMRPFDFKADHPFVFGIRDTKTGKWLFLGRLTNPKG